MRLTDTSIFPAVLVRRRAISSPDQIAAVNLYLPSDRANWILNSDGTGGPTAIDGTIGRIATGKPGTPYANGGISPRRRADGIEFVAAAFAYLNLSASVSYAGPFTAWFSFMAPTDAPRLTLVGNSGNAARVEIVGGQISLFNGASVNRILTFAGPGIPALVRIRRDAANLVFMAYSGTPEALCAGGALTGTITFNQVGYSQGAGGGYGGTIPTTPRFLGWCLADADLVTDSAAAVAAIQADFLTRDGVAL